MRTANDISSHQGPNERKLSTSSTEGEDAHRHHQKPFKAKQVPPLDGFMSARQDEVTPREYSYLVSRLVETPRAPVPVTSLPIYYVPSTASYMHTKPTARHMTWPAPGSPDNVDIISGVEKILLNEAEMVKIC